MYRTYLRIVLYLSTISLYTWNGYRMTRNARFDEPEPLLKMFWTCQFRFFTVWTYICFQLHAVIGLICEFLVVNNPESRTYKPPKVITSLRDTFFWTILVPSTFTTVLVFWSIFNYDRELMMPVIMDKVLDSLSNHILHSAILVIVLLEILLHPRQSPKSHTLNIIINIAYYMLYTAVTFYTYFEKGVWLYPILGKIYGTVVMPFAVIAHLGLGVLTYQLGCKINSLVWDKPERKRPAKKLKRRD